VSDKWCSFHIGSRRICTNFAWVTNSLQHNDSLLSLNLSGIIEESERLSLLYHNQVSLGCEIDANGIEAIAAMLGVNRTLVDINIDCV
jgi:hypothetical protein